MKISWYFVIKYLQSLCRLTITGIFWFEIEFLLWALGSIGSLKYQDLVPKK